MTLESMENGQQANAPRRTSFSYAIRRGLLFASPIFILNILVYLYELVGRTIYWSPLLNSVIRQIMEWYGEIFMTPFFIVWYFLWFFAAGIVLVPLILCAIHLGIITLLVWLYQRFLGTVPSRQRAATYVRSTLLIVFGVFCLIAIATSAIVITVWITYDRDEYLQQIRENRNESVTTNVNTPVNEIEESPTLDPDYRINNLLISELAPNRYAMWASPAHDPKMVSDPNGDFIKQADVSDVLVEYISGVKQKEILSLDNDGSDEVTVGPFVVRRHPAGVICKPNLPMFTIEYAGATTDKTAINITTKKIGEPQYAQSANNIIVSPQTTRTCPEPSCCSNYASSDIWPLNEDLITSDCSSRAIGNELASYRCQINIQPFQYTAKTTTLIAKNFYIEFEIK